MAIRKSANTRGSTGKKGKREGKKARIRGSKGKRKRRRRKEEVESRGGKENQRGDVERKEREKERRTIRAGSAKKKWANRERVCIGRLQNRDEESETKTTIRGSKKTSTNGKKYVDKKKIRKKVC